MRKLLLGATVVGVGAFIAFGYVRREDERGAVPTADPAAGRYAFEDATDARGIRFVHDPGPPRFYFPEIVGVGVALFDFDNDGRLDVLFRGAVAGPPHPGGKKGRSCALYRQQADGSFTDVTASSGLDHCGYAMGVSVGDVDNDGRPDVYLTNVGGDRLHLNCGNGVFRDATAESGLDNTGWATSATFVDFDRDGRLDLYVCNYCDHSNLKPCLYGKGQDYCHPQMYAGVQHRLYRNVSTAGKVRFVDVTVQAGMAGGKARGMGVVATDFNDDGWPDLYVCNDAEPNFVWINNRRGGFTERGVEFGGAVDASGKPLGSMGVAECDFAGEGRLGVVYPALRGEHTALQRNNAFGLLEESATTGLAPATRRFTGFGVAVVDVDQDGTPELLQLNGATVQPDDRERAAPDDPERFWRSYEQAPLLLQYSGGRFEDATAQSAAWGKCVCVGRGLAVGDVDGDGAVDLVAVSLAGRGRLFLNHAPNRGHWLQLRVVDPNHGGRDAYGARVVLRVAGRRVVKTVQTGSSYESANAPALHFGLGSSSQYDGVEVRWPDGSLDVEAFPGGPADRVARIERGKGIR